MTCRTPIALNTGKSVTGAFAWGTKCRRAGPDLAPFTVMSLRL